MQTRTLVSDFAQRPEWSLIGFSSCPSPSSDPAEFNFYLTNPPEKIMGLSKKGLLMNALMTTIGIITGPTYRGLNGG